MNSVKKIFLAGCVLVPSIELSASDGGTPESPTIIMAAEGETPVISGGVLVDGWEQAGAVAGLPEVAQGQIWQMPTPVVGGKPVEFRQMWINGVKMRRASTFDDMSMPQIISVDKSAKTLTVPRPLMDLSNAVASSLSSNNKGNIHTLKSAYLV